MGELLNDNLYKTIKELIEKSRNSVLRYVNTTMVFTYFQVGKIIVEDQQSGLERAAYAKQTLKTISVRLNQQFGRGWIFRTC